MRSTAIREERFALRALACSVLLLAAGVCAQVAVARVDRASAAPFGVALPQSAQEPSPREVELQRNALRRARERDAVVAIALLALGALFLTYRRRADRARLAEELSLTDPLTGLRNRRYLDQVIAMDVAASIRHHRDAAAVGQSAVDADLVFLLLDIDNFKRVNDTYGHAVGDHVLRSVAAVLRTASRDSDVVVRWGGEEFLIVGRFTDRVLAGATAERIREAVEKHSVVFDDDQRIAVTCSIGFASFPFDPVYRDALSWEQVLLLADMAAYDAKRGGRNRWVGYASAGWIPVLGERVSLDEVDRWVASGRLLRLTKEGTGLSERSVPSAQPFPSEPPVHSEPRERPRLQLMSRFSPDGGPRLPGYPGSPVRAG